MDNGTEIGRHIFWRIARPINGISINGNEYVLNENGEPIEFFSEKDATLFLKEHGYTDEDIESEGIVFEKNDQIELATFPDDDANYCKCFTIPTEWLLEILEKMDYCNERKGVDLERFLDNYIWEETWFIYENAKSAGKIIREEEQK